jgi:hypothetical protein
VFKIIPLNRHIDGGAFPLTWNQTATGLRGNWQEWDAVLYGNPNSVTLTAPGGGAIIDRMVLTVVPEPGTVIAGALLLLPFALSTLRVLRRNRAA